MPACLNCRKPAFPLPGFNYYEVNHTINKYTFISTCFSVYSIP